MLKMKKMLSTALAITMIASMGTSASAASQGWDLVDSGGHLDWDSNTKYLSNVNSGIDLWEGHILV